MLLSAPLFICSAWAKGGVSLRGSARSLDRQNRAARSAQLKAHRHGYQVRASVKSGRIVRVRPTATLELANVSYPYAHPQLKKFIETLSRAYFKNCGAKMVVTSLIRPRAEQPRNASRRSVHPHGIAVDLRKPWRACRRWLEPHLLSLEKQGMVEATRERRPPHYHVTIDPQKINAYLTKRGQKKGRSYKKDSRRRSRRLKHRTPRRYKVRSGDSLWSLSRSWKTSISSIQRINRLSKDMLDIDQILIIPQR